MRLTIVVLFALVGALSVPPGGSIAQDPPRDTPSKTPPAIDKEQLKQAQELLASLDKRTYVLLAGLRYLLRNEFEEELFAGRWRQACPLEPFEKAGTGALDTAELLRLWAVLETGLPRNPAIDARVARLAVTPPPEIKNELAPAGLYMLALRAAARRLSVTDAAKLLENARQVLAGCKAAVNVCSPQSYFASPEVLAVEWYANHFWRAVINRCALDLGLQAEFKQWGRDLDFLGRAHIEGLGWACQRGQPPDISEDLNANLLGMAAFGLAAGAPAGQFTRTNLTDIETATGRMSATLDRLLSAYSEPFGGARLSLVMLFSAAPLEIKDGQYWRNLLSAAYFEGMKAGTLGKSKSGLAQAFGFARPETKPDTLCEIAEAVLLLMPACGGILSANDGPLAKLGLPEIGRIMHAMALVEASSAPATKPLPAIEVRANAALEKARKFLVASQNPDGSFPGDMWGGPKAQGTGVQCLTVMALLHAGEPRDSACIRKAMSYLESRNFSRRFETYEASLQLMLLEKYFEKEIAQAGMFDVTNIREYNTARDKLVELMPRAYRELAKSCTKVLLEKRVFELDGYNYSCGGSPKPIKPRTPTPAVPGTPKGPVPGKPITRDPKPVPPPKPKTMQASGGGSGWDNSNSQFAIMGLKAACMLAISVPSSVFRYELERVIGESEMDHGLAHVPMERPWKTPPPVDAKRAARQSRVPEHAHCFKFFYRPDWQDYLPDGRDTPPTTSKDSKDGKDDKSPKDDVGSGSFGCSAGMLASLAICFDELMLRGDWTRGELELELERYGDQVLWGGLSWLSFCMLKPAAGYTNRWQTAMTEPNSRALDGVGFYYDAWSLSRACRQLGATTLAGGNDWYEILAKKICDNQLAEGGWGVVSNAPVKNQKAALCNTAFAILVLTRASQPVLSGERRGYDTPPRGPAVPATPEPKAKPTEPEKGPSTGESR